MFERFSSSLAVVAVVVGLWMLPCSMTAARAEAVAAALGNGTARIWFYRDYSPYVNTNYATVSINGVVAGSVDPYGGAIYRDLPPGRYHLTANSYVADPNEAADVDLAPGQVAYVKIESLPSWQNPTLGSTQRDSYFLRPMPAALAQAEMAQRRF